VEQIEAADEFYGDFNEPNSNEEWGGYADKGGDSPRSSDDGVVEAVPRNSESDYGLY
jgi:hypothetical protein